MKSHLPAILWERDWHCEDTSGVNPAASGSTVRFVCKSKGKRWFSKQTYGDRTSGGSHTPWRLARREALRPHTTAVRNCADPWDFEAAIRSVEDTAAPEFSADE